MIEITFSPFFVFIDIIPGTFSIIKNFGLIIFTNLTNSTNKLLRGSLTSLPPAVRLVTDEATGNEIYYRIDGGTRFEILDSLGVESDMIDWLFFQTIFKDLVVLNN